MYIAVTIKRYRAVKEVGKIKMIVGITAYYQVMQVCQSDQQFQPNKAVPHFANQRGNNYMHIPVAPSFAAALPPTGKHLMPVHGIEFQPSEVCPKNFIIFDQNDHRSQIMFHPAVAHKFSGPGLNMYGSYNPENFDREEINGIEREVSSSSLKEDSDDIDALLSLEEDEQDEYDEKKLAQHELMEIMEATPLIRTQLVVLSPGKMDLLLFRTPLEMVAALTVKGNDRR
ncbi:hypothetical protein GH714_043130 [Hevea brasiliensis]|uniref:Uncharacterized protein n=1 Tax=Hevea brasiliensis TaxID=3981 RepID=A0A6A6K614_HEVBR|nr:hypothetical protein GH714_043130 [Hevea brasiliensis]